MGLPARKQLNRPVDLFDQMPPHDLEAEKHVLGSVLLLPDLMDELAEWVLASDFYLELNQQVYDAMLTLFHAGKRVDAKLVTNELKKRSRLDSGMILHLNDQVGGVPSPVNCRHYAEIVVDQALRRGMRSAGFELVARCYDYGAAAREQLDRCERDVYRLHEERVVSEIKSGPDVLQMAINEIVAAKEQKAKPRWLETGYERLDKLIHGLGYGELICLAARPSMGKSALASNIATNIALRGQQVLFVSLEMSALSLAERMLSSQAQVDGYRLQRGWLSSGEMEALVSAQGALSQAKISFDETVRKSMRNVAAAARRMKRSHDLQLVVIDYLQLVDPEDPRDPRELQVSKIGKAAKAIARELELPVLILCQLNREIEKRVNRRPRLSDLRESGAIEQDCDKVLFVHREEQFSAPEDLKPGGKDHHLVGRAQVIVAKNRNGKIGDVDFLWRAPYTRFDEAPQNEWDDKPLREQAQEMF